MSQRNNPDRVEQTESMLRPFSVTLTAVAAGNYAANDVISADADAGEGVAVELAIGRSVGDVFNVAELVIVCSEDSVLFRPRLHFFNYNPAAADVEMDDNSAFTINGATGSAGYLGSIDMPAFQDRGAVAVSERAEINKKLACAEDTHKLYMVVETLDAETNETAGMTLRFDFTLGGN